MTFEDILVNVFGDVVPGLLRLFLAVCWIAGMLVGAQGLLRLRRHSEGAGAPSAWGTLWTFVLALVLLTLPAWLDGAAATFFGTPPAPGQALAWTSGSGPGAFESAIAAVVVVVNVVGLFAFVNGWWTLRAASDGKDSYATGLWRITGGILCWHVVPVVAALQQTLGVSILQVR